MSSLCDPQPSLNADERRALSLAATGLYVAEVAEVMGLSAEAVRQLHASAIAKLGARSKLEAVLIADRHGLLDLPT